VPRQSDGRWLAQLALDYPYRVALPRSPCLNLLVSALLFDPISLFGLLAGATPPKNEDLFLDQRVAAESAP
jgi:hypothetical protein